MPKYLTNLDIQATPIEQTHAARLKDVYDIVGSHMKDPVLVATTEPLLATYASATMTLTSNTNVALAIDGISLAAADRVLVTEQTDSTQNGIYVVSAVGDGSNPWVLTRADDFNATSKIFTGVKVHVIKGTSYADSTFVLTTDSPVLDSTSLVFVLDTGKLVLIEEKRFDVVGDGTTTTFPFTHGWNTRAVTVDVIQKTGDYETVYVDVIRPSLNAISVTFASAPAVGDDYQVIVRAEVN
jgi:hypothetical protein